MTPKQINQYALAAVTLTVATCVIIETIEDQRMKRAKAKRRRLFAQHQIIFDERFLAMTKDLKTD